MRLNQGKALPSLAGAQINLGTACGMYFLQASSSIKSKWNLILSWAERTAGSQPSSNLFTSYKGFQNRLVGHLHFPCYSWASPTPHSSGSAPKRRNCWVETHAARDTGQRRAPSLKIPPLQRAFASRSSRVCKRSC